MVIRVMRVIQVIRVMRAPTEFPVMQDLREIPGRVGMAQGGKGSPPAIREHIGVRYTVWEDRALEPVLVVPPEIATP